MFTILARKDAKIAGFDDLKGKRVNIGNPGSGQRDTFEEIMAVKGWKKGDFGLVSELKLPSRPQHWVTTTSTP